MGRASRQPTSSARAATSSRWRRSTADDNTSARASVGGSTTPCEVAPGLVAAYAFEEGSGPLAYDASGSWRNGIVTGATWAAGRNGSGLSLDGVDDHVSLGALGTFYTGGFTLEAWVRKSTLKKDAAVVGSWAGNGPMLWVDHIAGHHYLTLGDTFPNYLDSGVIPALETWQHVAATSDGVTARYYVDGVEVASRALSGPVGNSNTWRIGAYGPVPGGFLDGVVDDVRIYDRALSAGEIQFDRDHGVVALPVPPDLTPPSAPGTLAATAGVGQISLSWGAATDNMGVVGYNVHRSTSAGFTPSGANRIAQPTGTTFADTGLAAGATFYYKVTAEDAAGNVGPASNEATATVSDPIPPSAPGTLVATGGFNQAALSWGAATDNVGVVRYNVHRATTSGFTPTSGNRIAQPTGTSFTNTGVAPGTYYYKVTAEDAAGNVGPVSNQASAVVVADTTPPTVSITAPTAGSTVSGVTTVSANASDNAAVAGVQFRVGGVNVGAEDTTAPYSVDWNTRAHLNGPLSLTAVARDPSGNTRTSAAVSVTAANAISLPGLRAAYPLDETSGTTAADWSGASQNGTTVGTTWTAGTYGNAAAFDGVSDRIDLPALGLFYKTGFTYEAWVRKSTAKKDVTLLGSWTGAGSGGPMIWVDHLSGRYHLTFGSASLADYLDSGRTPTVGQWEHVAATYDGTTARFYIGGVEVASRTFTGNVGNANTWRLGAYEAPPAGFFDGAVDNVRIYDRALSARRGRARHELPDPAGDDAAGRDRGYAR